MANQKFDFATQRSEELEELHVIRPGWQETLRVFCKNKGAVVGAIFVGLMIILAIVGPHLNEYTYEYQQITKQNLPPRIPILEDFGIFDGTKNGIDMYELKDCAEDYFWFGTDILGRDLFTRFCQGIRISFIVALASAILNMVIGIPYGMVSGYYGGKIDLIMQRVTEVISGIPTLVVVSLMVVVLEPGLVSIILAMSISSWIGMSRLVRANTLRLKAMDHIMASKTLGTNTPRILFVEVLPNITSSIIVMAMLSIPGAIFLESFLSFIGLGIPAPQASLGSLISDGYTQMLIYPYQLAIPATFFSLLMIALNLMGNGLRDALDPKQKQV